MPSQLRRAFFGIHPGSLAQHLAFPHSSPFEWLKLGEAPVGRGMGEWNPKNCPVPL